MVAILETTPYQEFIEFVASSPTLTQIAEFHLSDASEARISYLLERNREGILSPDETVELDDYTRLEHIIQSVKVRALEKLNEA